VIREDRDAGFWSSVCHHPQVEPLVCLGHSVDLGPLLASPTCTALRSENGGFLFVRLDGLGRVHELHTMYLPKAWGGREILIAAKAAFAEMFARGSQVVVTYEVQGNPRSQPPRSFRFERAGDFAFAPLIGASVRSWVLTRAAWEGSPARQRMTA
jgi:hypothetical protein